MKWLIKRYMVNAHIESLQELSERTGIKRRHLSDLINDPRRIKVFEIMALNDVLHFDEQDLLKLIRGEYG